MKKLFRAVASIFFVVLAVSALADWTSLQKKFQDAKTREEAVGLVKKTKYASETDVSDKISTFESAKGKKEKEDAYYSLKQLVDANALSENFSVSKGADATAKSIKKDPIYDARKEAKSSNWFNKLMDRAKKLFQKPNLPDNKIGPPPAWMLYIVWGFCFLLIVALLVGLVLLVINLPWAWTKAGRARKANRGGILEDGEALLSEDEYLIEADRLIAEGRYREACRCLYLATLLRFDATRIARFEPAQTNWEHCRRIEASKILPTPIPFRPTTKAFDLAWYGYRAKHLDDVMIFRETYVSVKNLTEGMV